MQGDTLSVVMLLWRRETYPLNHSLYTLSNQTVPPYEIVVVDANMPGDASGPRRKDFSEEIADICSHYPLARVVSAPRPDFNMSWGINVGIKRTAETSKFVMATGFEMIFSRNTVEYLMERMHERAIAFAPCGFLKEGVAVPDDPWADWSRLLASVHPNPPKVISTGTLLLSSRDWWFMVHGYDEKNHPFNYADSDISLRAKMDHLEIVLLPWDTAQVLHQWHPLSSQYHMRSDYPNPNWGIVRNGDKWGEIQ